MYMYPTSADVYRICRSRQNLVNDTHLIYEVLGSYPANFMKLSPLFMEIWSFETIHCLNFHPQRQKRHDATNDVKVNFLICGVCRVNEKHNISC